MRDAHKARALPNKKLPRGIERQDELLELIENDSTKKTSSAPPSTKKTDRTQKQTQTRPPLLPQKAMTPLLMQANPPLPMQANPLLPIQAMPRPQKKPPTLPKPQPPQANPPLLVQAMPRMPMRARHLPPSQAIRQRPSPSAGTAKTRPSQTHAHGSPSLTPSARQATSSHAK